MSVVLEHICLSTLLLTVYRTLYTIERSTALKRLLFIILVNLILFAFIYTTYKYSETLENEVPDNAKVTALEDTTTDKTLYGQEYSQVDITVLMEKDMPTEKIFNEIQQAISLLPPDIIKSFVAEDWKIMVVSNIDFSNSPYEKENPTDPQLTVGFTNYETKIIQIKNIETDNFVKLKFLHEISHYIDKKYNEKSCTDEFKALYEKYKDDYVEYEYFNVPVNTQNKADIEYAKSSNYEFFACTMKDYLYHNSYIEENYPDLYVYYNSFMTRN